MIDHWGFTLQAVSFLKGQTNPSQSELQNSCLSQGQWIVCSPEAQCKDQWYLYYEQPMPQTQSAPGPAIHINSMR